MKKLQIYSRITVFICGCATTQSQENIVLSTPPYREITQHQSTQAAPETIPLSSKKASANHQEFIEKPIQKSLGPSETGTATYYAPDMEGRTTASGEPYDPEQLTAAHRTIPIGSSVRVTNLKTKQQIIVRINDRWGGGGDRIINLSKQATVQLGFGSAGTMPVQLDVEALPSGRHMAQPSVRTQPLPARIEESSIKNHSKSNVCQNEADILGLTGDFFRNHVTACLTRRE